MYLNSETGNIVFGPSGGILQSLERVRKYARSSGDTGYFFPPIPTGASVAFFIRGSGFAGSISQFLFDNRDMGSAFWYNAGRTGMLIRVDGNLPLSAGLNDLNGNVWRKVYIEVPVDNPFHLCSRFSENEFIAQHDISEIAVYNRVWTVAELNDTSSYLPDSGIIAKYDCTRIFAMAGADYLADVSGNEFHTKIIGATPVLF